MDVSQSTSNSKSNDSAFYEYTEANKERVTLLDSNAAEVTRDGPSAALSSTTNMLPPGARSVLSPGASLASIFRFHMGIENDDDLVPSYLAKKHSIDPIATGANKGRRAVNMGLYNRVVREERSSLLLFQVWNIVINLALGLQIIFAAILTGLGAGHGPSDAVAIFGILNTIIAGFLTFLKGTGLPMRMKYFYNQWLKLRVYIEQRERDFASDDHLAVHLLGYKELMEEVHVIESMYHNVRKDIERHTPDNFGGARGDSNESAAPGEGAPASKLAKMGLTAFKAKLSGANGADGAGEVADHAQHGAESRIKSVIEDVEKRISSHLTNQLTKLTEAPQTETRSNVISSPFRAKEQGGGVETDLEANQEDSDSEVYDVSELELRRTKQRQAQALAAQRQAEKRILELEQKLAAMSATKLDGGAA